MSDEPIRPDPAGDVLGRALEDLQRGIRERWRPGPEEEGGTGFDPLALFDEARRRLAHFGMSERSWEVDEFGLDAHSLGRARRLLDFLADRYWRIEAEGLALLPSEQPCLFVSNRSGLLPWDGLMVAHMVSRSLSAAPRPRFLVADWLLTLPFVHAFLARLGGVRACRENAERLIRSGHSVVAFPEGQKGAAKVFRERYRLRRFGRGGVVRVAIAMRCPLVPVAVVGAEEVHPILFKLESAARMAGVPFLPVTPTFPALGPLGLLPLPSKWSIRFGTPVSTEHLGMEAAEDELLVSRMTEELRAEIQRAVNAGLRERASVWG
ncbi:MAG: lysophospholipid acyltransferase family protein [Myxococcota bacterium]